MKFLLLASKTRTKFQTRPFESHLLLRLTSMSGNVLSLLMKLLYSTVKKKKKSKLVPINLIQLNYPEMLDLKISHPYAK